MDLSLAIERHRKPLLRIVATLYTMIGLAEGAVVERLPVPVYRTVLRLLRPAESAVRRLVVIVSRGLAPPKSRPAAGADKRLPNSRKSVARIAFRLFDPRPRFASAFAFERPRGGRFIRPVKGPGPRIRVIDTAFDPRVPFFRQAQVSAAPAPLPPLQPDGTVSAVRLSRRLAAVKQALEDLPRQARRYLRWQARPAGQRRPNLTSALRPGPPPGHRKKPVHKVDHILSACDWLARQVPEPDTS